MGVEGKPATNVNVYKREDVDTYPGSFGTRGFGRPRTCTLGRDPYAVNGWATKRSKYERDFCFGRGSGGAGGIFGDGAADVRRCVSVI